MEDTDPSIPVLKREIETLQYNITVVVADINRLAQYYKEILDDLLHERNAFLKYKLPKSYTHLLRGLLQPSHKGTT